MRILHTSDWHLGRSFHGVDLLAAQAAFVDHLVDTVSRERIDLVLVAGDVYDRALPPVDAVRLADETLHRLAATKARVVVTSGNHDSAQRLGFNSRLVDLAGIHLRTDPGRVGEPVVLGDDHGEVVVHGLPYLEPDVVRQQWGLDSRSHHASLTEAMRRVRRDLARRPTARSVVMAHAFVAGGEPSDSERDISVGGVSLVPVSLFDGIDYTALGHLHGRSRLSDSAHYSGSPLAYSFSEVTHLKGSWLVDLGAEGVVTSEFIEAPVPRPLAAVQGSLEQLLTDPRLGVHEDAWLQATLTDPSRPVQAMERLRQRFPHALTLRFAPLGQPPASTRTPTATHSPHDIALDFVGHVRGGEATDAESALLREAFDCCPEDPDLTAELAHVSGAHG